MDLAPNRIPVPRGQMGESAGPDGDRINRRPADGAIFAIVAPKTGGSTDYLWQYRISAPEHRPSAGSGYGVSEHSAEKAQPPTKSVHRSGRDRRRARVCVLQHNDTGIPNTRQNPDAQDASRELAVFGFNGIGDREGLAIYKTGPHGLHRVSAIS